MTKDIIRIVGFEKDITLWAAETKSFFAEQNLAVSFDQTRNSTEEISGILAGQWDIAFDNGDNVVAWDEGQGADGKPHDLFIFMGGSRQLAQALFVHPSIKEIRDLKDRILGADAAATGFAVVLRYILQCHNLSFGRDYSFKSVGSSRMRLSELVAGKIAGAMLNPRYVEEAGVENLRVLALGKDYADPYPARIGLATRRWAETHAALLTRFIRAMIGATDWIFDPKNREEIIELTKSKIGRDSARAEADYRRLLDPSEGLTARGAFDPDTLRTVLEMRQKLDIINVPLPPLTKYYDESFYREAVSLIR